MPRRQVTEVVYPLANIYYCQCSHRTGSMVGRPTPSRSDRTRYAIGTIAAIAGVATKTTGGA